MDTLETVGEIAATLAGFSAILVAIQFERLKGELVAVRDFLLSALSAILIAFVPRLLVGVVDEALLWRVACGGFGLYHFLLAAIITRQHLRYRNLQMAEWIFLLPSLVVIGLKLTVGAGYLAAYGLNIYLLGLVWFLFNSIFMFYGLLFRVIWQPPDAL